MALSPLPGLSAERFDRGLRAEVERLDPALDGWESEVVAERVLDQLQRFAGWIETGRDGLCPLSFTRDFQGVAQNSAALPLVYDHSPFQIRRGAASILTDQATWIQDWPAATKVHFKVIHVLTNSPTQVEVTLLMDCSSTQWQENALWKTVWDVAAETVTLQSLTMPFYERADRSHHTPPLFVDATGTVLGGESAYVNQLAHGIDHWRERLDRRFGIEITGPHGIALGDVNGDGRDDLYVCETGGLPNRLFVQQADGTARDLSQQAGVDFIESTHSALLVDWDNDGHQDLIAAVGRHVFFYANDGQAQFVQKAVAQSDSVSRSMAAADFDGDGDLDLYICGYSNRHGDGIGLGRPFPYHDANNGVQNHLLANLGNWRFEDITVAVGLDMNNQRFSYAAAWEDFDNDGDPDLYVANDFGRNNLYQNNAGRFSDIAANAGVEDLSAGMSVSWADYDHDGWMDLYVGNMFSSAGNRIAYQRTYRAGLDDSTRSALQRHARGNSLFQNTPDATFNDVTLTAGVNMGRWAWSSNFADVNNDSFEDLLIANGMVTAVDDTGDL